MAARRDTLAREVESREKEAAAVAVQRDRLSKVSSAIDEFYGKRIGTPRETLAPVVLEIHGLLTQAGVAPASISYSTKPIPGLPVMEMQIAFSFRNDYNQLKQLLGAIESGRRWIVVRNIALARDRDLPGAVGVQMTLATYFAKPEDMERVPGPGGLSAGVPSPLGRASSPAKRRAQ